MSTMRMSFCLKAVKTLGNHDLSAITEAIETYVKAGMATKAAERAAVADLTEQVNGERGEVVGLLREQHPQVFTNEPTGRLSVDDAPSGQDTTPRDTPEASPADRAAVQRLQDALAKRIPGLVLEAVAPPARGADAQLSSVADRSAAAATELAGRLFDKRVILFRSSTPFAQGVQQDNQPGVIFLNADSARHPMAVVGHELLHTLRQDRPDLYRELDNRLSRLLRDAGKYGAALNAKYEARGLGRLNADTLQEELIADIVGDQWTDPQFWNELAKDQPEGFRAVLEAVLKFLDDVIAKVTAVRPFGTDQYLTDLTKARTAVADALRNYSAGEVGTVAVPTDTIRFSVAPATDSDAFKRWFGDSKVVDAQGRPMVVHHGSDRELTEFEPGRRDPGVWFTSRLETAASYGKGDDAHVHSVYLKASKPFVANFSSWSGSGPVRIGEKEFDSNVAIAKYAERNGYDSVNFPVGNFSEDDNTWVVFRSEQIKSAISNLGSFDPTNPDIRFSIADQVRDGIRGFDQTAARNLFLDMTANAGKLGFWGKTIGTQYAKAQKHPLTFGRVFDAAQDYIKDINIFANSAADMAPTILPKLETWRDLKKGGLLRHGADPVDLKAAGSTVFQGTLSWTRDAGGKLVEIDKVRADAEKLSVDAKAKLLVRGNRLGERVLKMWQGMEVDRYEKMVTEKFEREFLKPGVVFTDSELRKMGLTDPQIGLYREFRAAVDQSLTDLAKSEMLRLAGSDGDAVATQVMAADNLADAATVLREHFDKLSTAAPDRKESLDKTHEAIADKSTQVDRLKHEGYAPLMRFGRHTLHIKRGDETEYFGMYESRREANKAAREMQSDPQFKGSTFSRGLMSQEAYKLYAGLPMDALELFAQTTGNEQNEVYQDFLRLTKNNRSALKRMIHRQGIAGFSEDTARVLASFVTSNARMASGNRNLSRAKKAADAIPKELGDLKDDAVKLVQYVQDPQEEAAALRGLLFTNFIGGSVASAAVNLTQSLTMTLPYLSQFGGAVKATQHLMAAARTAAGGKAQGELAEALDRAEKDGVVSPQEIHHLQAEAMGRISHPVLKKAAFIWGSMFSLAEQFNRRVAFIAAYNVAKENHIADPFAFAEKAVMETQGLYCVDEATECLTSSGWKGQADMKAGATVYAIDAEGGLVESRLLDVHRFTGAMRATEFRNSNGFSMVVTDQHDMLIRSHNSRTNTYGTIRRAKPGDVKVGHHFLRVPLSDATLREAVYSDDEVQLFAWVAAEGSLFAHRNVKEKRGVSIVQSASHNPQYVAEIDALLKRLGGHSNRSERDAAGGGRMVRWQLRKPLWSKIHEALPGKLLGFDFVTKLTPAQMALFIETFTKGDGHIPEDGGRIITQKSIANLDALQAMAVLSGQTSTKYDRMGRHDFGALYVAKNSKHAHARPMVRTAVLLPMVWCPETEHGTWIARRNGRTFVTGNSKANKPNLARGPIGATVMTFRQFSIHYLEFLERMWRSGPEGKRAVGVALAILVMVAGAGGLPFADDLDDAVDTLAQALGYDFSSKAAKRKFVAETLGLGNVAADVATRGLSSLPGFPIDVSLRMGMGNLLPGTGALLRSNTDRSRDVLEFAGAAGGLAKNAMDAGGKLLSGEVAQAGLTMAPVAIQNVAKAMQMWNTGEYRNSRDQKVMDTGPLDGAMKLIGFQPAEVARESAAMREVQRSVQLAKNVEGEIAAKWASGLNDNDPDKVRRAREDLADWNRKNPETQMRITMQQIIKRVREMRLSREERAIKAAPRELREKVREAF